LTSSYFWVSARRSSSDMSGLKTTMVSYCLSPGGHCGSSFSSTAVNPVPGIIGSSPEPNPPSKKEPEKSRVSALTEKLFLLFWWKWEIDSGNARNGEDVWGAQREEEDESGIELSKEDAIDASALRRRRWTVSERMDKKKI